MNTPAPTDRPLDLERRCRDLLSELGIDGASGHALSVRPLVGGVASDIAMLEWGNRRLCVKFALPRLKVAELWQAPVHRNRAEYEWLRVAATVAPESAVELFGCSQALHGFAMEYLQGDDVILWKAALLQEQHGRGAAAQVGDLLGRVHAASTVQGFDTTKFHNHGDFQALRIEPYLTFTSQRWPEVADQLTRLANELLVVEQVLVHGDVSPKNILFRAGHPIILDAECATMGDASFDSAFCLNHLVLKAIHLPNSRRVLFHSVLAFWQRYITHVSWEAPKALEVRVCRLIPALMLARIDGKSPVEYLDEREREVVRALAIPLIRSPPPTLQSLVQRLSSKL